MIEAAGLQVFGDVGIDQPDLAAARVGIGLGDRRLAGAQRLDLAAGQRDAGLELLADLVVEARLAVLRDDLEASARPWRPSDLTISRSRSRRISSAARQRPRAASPATSSPIGDCQRPLLSSIGGSRRGRSSSARRRYWSRSGMPAACSGCRCRTRRARSISSRIGQADRDDAALLRHADAGRIDADFLGDRAGRRRSGSAGRSIPAHRSGSRAWAGCRPTIRPGCRRRAPTGERRRARSPTFSSNSDHVFASSAIRETLNSTCAAPRSLLFSDRGRIRQDGGMSPIFTSSADDQMCDAA